MEPIGYIILIFYFIILIAIGLFFSRKQDSINDFFLGGRSIPAWAAMAAIVASETSAVTFLGAPAKSFKVGGDMSFLQIAFGFLLARFLLAIFFLPKFFEHEIVTIYQYIGRRFGQHAQKLTGIFFFITRALAAGVRHYAAALVISVLLEMNLTTAIFVTGIVSLAYSYLGGISAVIWTEVVQLVIMITGGLLAFFYLLNLIPGGWNQIVETATAYDKFAVIHWDWTTTVNHYFFIGILAGICTTLATHGSDQDTVQRLLSCKSLRSAQIAIIGSGFFVFAQFAFFLLLGIMLFVYYGSLPAGLDEQDQILPFFAIHTMRPEASALVIAAILSAALSSTASALNSLSSTSVNDFVIALRKEPLDNQSLVRISRMFTLIWTMVLIAIATLASGSKSILDTGYSIPGYTYGSLLAAFLLGIFTPVKNQFSIIIGMVGGVIAVIIIALFTNQWTLYIVSGAFTTMTIAWLLDNTLFRSK